MNIVFYAPRFLPAVGGLERVTALWAEWLASQGHQVVLITFTPAQVHGQAPPLADAPCPAYTVLRHPGFWQQWRAMRRAQVVVQMDVSLKGLLPWLLCGRPLVISHHTGLYPPQGAKPLKQRLKYAVCQWLAKGQTACSHYIAAQLPGKPVIIHSPYQPAIFYPRHQPRQPFQVLYVGRLVSIKGVQVLLQAMQEAQQSLGTALQLTVAGQGPMEAELKAKAGQGGLQVHWLGSLPPAQVAALMNTLPLVVVPSLQEPFGTVVPEALACGASVICSNAGGLPEAAGHTHPLAQVVPANDAGALAAAIVAFFKQEVVPAPNPQALHRHLAGLTPASSGARLLQLLQQVV